MSKSRILVANVDELTQKSLYELLCRNEYNVDIASSLNEALLSIEKNLYHIILIELREPRDIEFLKTLRKNSYQPKIIILTPYGNVEMAAKAIKMGAFEYLIKPVEDKDILSSIDRAMSSQVLIKDEHPLIKKILGQDNTYSGLVGKSRTMQEIYSILERISSSKATVLVHGESGTGKRLIAQALHKRDKKRKDKPFVEVSCGGLPREIIESELFGHTKGAFTGAINDRKGRFEMAHEGTILLDDIDCLPLDLQVKLLRVLQHKEFERVGDNKTIKVDIRIIASTNQDLEKAVAEKKFREDLYYRLNVISITIPPLRSRKEDIPLLVEHFINNYSKENHKKIKSVSQDLLNILLEYDWPGNIRQLENIIERAVILDTDEVIEKEDLPEVLVNGNAYLKAESYKENTKNFYTKLKEVLKEPEKVYILRVLEETGWNKKKAAGRLGVNRTTLYNKLRKYNITSSSYKE